jgi:hypothetical protein
MESYVHRIINLTRVMQSYKPCKFVFNTLKFFEVDKGKEAYRFTPTGRGVLTRCLHRQDYFIFRFGSGNRDMQDVSIYGGKCAIFS